MSTTPTTRAPTAPNRPPPLHPPQRTQRTPPRRRTRPLPPHLAKLHPAWRRLSRTHNLTPITPQNLSAWRSSGYAHWLRDQSRADHIRTYAETASTIAQAAGGDPAAVGSRILAARMLDLLETADTETAPHLARAVANLRKGETDQQKLALERQRQRLAQESLDLQRQRFQRQTCELFIKWHADNRITTILTDTSTNNDEKTEALGRAIFGDELWR